jgi:hypothetical protein
MTRPMRRVALLAAVLVIALPAYARAGSTEPALAIAAAAATLDGTTLTLDVTANYDYGDVVRLGYPLAVVVTAGTTVTRLYADGSATVANGGGPPQPLAGVPGVVGLEPTRIQAALPAPAGTTASLRLEAAFDGKTLQSNAVAITW